uniref:Fatty acid desaturase n=1 Tax=uncultured bacterium CSLC2 TaxID=1091571 RepID=Q8KP04_9BACT|nr:fatty acid desaturase [uncultured bacterium CSLC2]
MTAVSLPRWVLAALSDWVIIFCAFFFIHAVLTNTVALPLEMRVCAVIVSAWLGAIVIGSRQHALAILGHEGAHGMIAKTMWLNDFLANLMCFWPLGSGIDGYRKFHFDHHHNLGTPRDPELEHKRRSAPEWDLPDTNRGIRIRFAKDLLGFGLNDLFLVEHYVGIFRRHMTVRDLMGPIVWWTVAVAVIGPMHLWWVIPVWFGALATAFWAFFRVRMWTEHLGTPNVHRITVVWWQRLFVPHNTWYHFEHHRFSNVPFFRLPLARALDTDEGITSLEALFESYRQWRRIPSGLPLHEEMDERFKLHSPMHS